MRSILALCLLSLTACGRGPDFSGQYGGAYQAKIGGDCPEATNWPNVPDGVQWWQLTQTNDVMVLETGRLCGPLTADLQGEFGRIRSLSCAPFDRNGASITLGIVSGSIRFEPKTLTAPLNANGYCSAREVDLSLDFEATAQNGNFSQCTGNFTGKLSMYLPGGCPTR